MRCPGCGLELSGGAPPYDGCFHTSPECWLLFTEVLAAEYADEDLFEDVHQLTVDSYAVQHAGSGHPDKSVGIHLVGLHLVLERGIRTIGVPPRMRKLASSVEEWPHFAPPASNGAITVEDVADTDTAAQHAEQVRAWAAQVWEAWRPHHDDVAELAGLVWSR